MTITEASDRLTSTFREVFNGQVPISFINHVVARTRKHLLSAIDIMSSLAYCEDPSSVMPTLDASTLQLLDLICQSCHTMEGYADMEAFIEYMLVNVKITREEFDSVEDFLICKETGAVTYSNIKSVQLAVDSLVIGVPAFVTEVMQAMRLLLLKRHDDLKKVFCAVRNSLDDHQLTKQGLKKVLNRFNKGNDAK